MIPDWPGMLAACGVVLTMMTILWVVSLRRNDVSIVDWFWGPAFALFGWVLIARADSVSPRAWLVVGLTTVWALRLAIHLWRRSRGKPEDPRYAAMRRRGGEAFRWISLFKVFLFQGLLVVIISAPIAQVVRAPGAGWSPLDGLGLLLFVVGFLFEAVGDRQLTRFRSDPANRGTVLDRGLWRYTRHPNYFGDALLWWGLGMFACATPGGWPALFGPLLMTVLLLKVSGVTLLEAGLIETRPAYREYIARTPAFVPWFPRKERM